MASFLFYFILPWHPPALLENEVYCSYMLPGPLRLGTEVLIGCSSIYTKVFFFQGLRLMLYDCCACN